MDMQTKRTSIDAEEFNQRCNKAIEELNKMANNYLINGNVHEYSRLSGKVEGIKLAQSYANEMIKAPTGDNNL